MINNGVSIDGNGVAVIVGMARDSKAFAVSSVVLDRKILSRTKARCEALIAPKGGHTQFEVT